MGLGCWGVGGLELDSGLDLGFLEVKWYEVKC